MLKIIQISYFFFLMKAEFTQPILSCVFILGIDYPDSIPHPHIPALLSTLEKE